MGASKTTKSTKILVLESFSIYIRTSRASGNDILRHMHLLYGSDHLPMQFTSMTVII